MGYHSHEFVQSSFEEGIRNACEVCDRYTVDNLQDEFDTLELFTNNILSTAGVSIKVDDLIKSKSMQDDIVKQVKAKIEQSSEYGGVLNLYKQKTQEMEGTLKELEELKKEMVGTEAEKKAAKIKIQDQEEKLKKPRIK